jgi:hypothetical protein
MRRRGNRQELGQPLDDAEDDRVENAHEIPCMQRGTLSGRR